MGKCIYCGKWAGFFKDKHDECVKNHQEYIKRKNDIEEIQTNAKLNLLNTIDDIWDTNKEELPSLNFSDYGIIPFFKKRNFNLCRRANRIIYD